MTRESAIARPCFSANHDLSSMVGIVLPNGHRLSMPFGKFTYRATLMHHRSVQTIDETRREGYAALGGT